METGWRSGPRLPRPSDPSEEVAGDPAFGEKVPRCKACGMPNPSDLVGDWNGLRVRFPLCQRCVFVVNPPDPLAA